MDPEEWRHLVARDADGSVWPPLVRIIADMDKRWIAILLLGGRRVWTGEEFASQGGSELITTQRVLFYTFNSISFKHFCVVILHLYSNWHVKDLAMTSNHICG